jgi:nucleoside-diphosphate-sugar epimerase
MTDGFVDYWENVVRFQPDRFEFSLARKMVDTQKVVFSETLDESSGILYGPGTGIAKDGAIVELLRNRRMPIVGDSAGIWSFIHIQDVARATATAVSGGTPGIYNVVDDEPAPVSSRLPFLADILRAEPPRRVPVRLARFPIGNGGVWMMTKIRGGSNAKTKRELGWQPIYPTGQRGFVEGLG